MPNGARVEVQRGESLDKALRRFKKKVQEAGVLSEIKRTTFYEKPSEKRRQKIREQELARKREECLARKAGNKRR